MLDLNKTIQSELPEARYLILELAALLDRIDAAAARHSSRTPDHPRLAAMRAAIELLPGGNQPDRAERILRLWSEPVEA